VSRAGAAGAVALAVLLSGDTAAAGAGSSFLTFVGVEPPNQLQPPRSIDVRTEAGNQPEDRM
jgi:hypothetical protein